MARLRLWPKQKVVTMKQHAGTFTSLPSPLRLFLTVLAIVFLTEVAVMFLLPVLLPGAHGLAEAIADAFILTVLSAPFLWWFAIRPLRSTAMVEVEHVRAATIITHSPDGIITVNEQGLVESFNQAAERIFGYGEEEVLGKPVEVLLPDRFRERHVGHRAGYMVQPTTRPMGVGLELYGRRKDGSEFPADIMLSPLETAQGSLVIAVIRDITERKRAEEALRENEARFALFMNNLPGVAWIKDTEGRYIYVNEPYEKTFHMRLSDWRGKTDDEVWPPALAAQYRENDRQVMRSREALQTVETTLQDDGPHYWLVNKFPLLDESGTLVMVGGVAVDITEHKRVEETLHALYRASLAIQEPIALQSRLDYLLQTAQKVLHLDRLNVLLADSEGRWLEAVASTETEEPLAALRVPIGPEGGGLAQAYLTQQMVVWEGQAPVPEDLRLKPPYDQLAAFRSQVFVIVPLVVQGLAIGVLAADRKHSRRPLEPATLDPLQLFANQAALAIEHARLYEQVQEQARELERRVEERTRALKEAQAQLVQSTKLAAVGTLAAGVAHELNQPLTVIRGYAQGLMADARLDPGVKADLDRIQAQTTRMAKIINHLRDFSRQSTGTFEPVSLNKIIEDSFTLLNQQLQFRNIEVVKALDPALPTIHGDRFQLEQVFVNLITNARDAMQPQGGGRLTVTTRVAGRFVEAAVADTGPGIPGDIQDQIFDPFFTTKEVGQGTGLGLSISYGIITEHGGEIRFENRPEGGTVFVVRLPLPQASGRGERQAARSGA